MMFSLLLTSALAGPLLFRFADPDSLAESPVLGVVEAGEARAEFSPMDDGNPPDVHAADGVRTVVVEAPDAPSLRVVLTDGAGRVWEGTIERPEGDAPDVDLLLESSGALSPYEPTVPGGNQEGFVGEALPAKGFGGPALPWGVALAGWGIAVAIFAQQRRARAPSAAPGRRPALGPGLHRVAAESAGALLTQLATEHRVVVLGDPPEASFAEGDVFPMPPSSLRIGEIAATVDALRGRGRPVAVLALAWPERLEDAGERALADLAAMVPDAAIVVPVR